MRTTTTLAALQTSLYRANWKHGASGGGTHIFHVQAAAHSFDPLSIAAITQRRLEAKRRKGLLYGVTPLWLVLGVSDIRGVWGESMTLLASSCPAIEPYDRVIVHNGSEALTWSAGDLVAMRDISRASAA